MEARTSLRLPLGLGLALVALVFATFRGVSENDFLGYDDPLYVGAPEIQDGLTVEGLRWALASGRASNWHPITWASHMLDVELFGSDPAGHHLMGLGLHALNALLLGLFLWRATGRVVPAFLAAGLFAVHPLRVESVAWAAERKDLLAGTFGLLALLAHLARARGGGARAAFGCGLAFALGLAAKPTLVPLPLVLLALDRWPLARVGERGWGPLLREKVPLFVLAAASAVGTVLVQGAGGAVESVAGLPLAARLANGMHSIAAYLGDTLWPRPTAVFQPHPWFMARDRLTELWVPGAVGAVLVVLLSASAWRLRRVRPELLCGWSLYLAFLLPVLGWVQVGSQARADRYTYLAGMGLTLGVVFALDGATRTRPVARRALVAAGLVALLVLAGATRREVRVWKNDETLFTAALERGPRNPVAHLQLGLVRMEQGDLARAVERFSAAYELDPATVEAPLNLAVAWLGEGRTDEALELLERLTREHPGVVEPWLNLGLGRLSVGDRIGAAAALTRAHELDRDDLRATAPLAGLRLAAGELTGAEPLLARLVQAYPGRADYRNDQALLFERTGREALALDGYEEARRLAGESELGARAARAAAWIFATSPDRSLHDATLAGSRARQALALLGDESATWSVLAAADARAGNFGQARSAQQEALRRTDDPVQRANLETLLALYRSGQAFTRP